MLIQLFAWESREFLRKKTVGKKIQFAVDHSTTREYVTAYLAPIAGFDPECINHSVVTEGWASVHKDAKRSYLINWVAKRKDRDLLIVKR